MALNTALREINRLGDFVELAEHGLRYSTEAIDWIHVSRRAAVALGDPDPFDSEKNVEVALKGASRLQEFAHQQLATGFSYLFHVCVVRLWTILESMIDEMLVDALRDISKFPDTQLLNRLEGPLVLFLDMEPEERARCLSDQIVTMLKAPLRYGVERFESILKPLGLSGGVPEEVVRAIFELQQLRNAIVHRNSIADRRLIQACPWLSVTLGATVNVGKAKYQKFAFSAAWYVIEIGVRIRQKRGQEATSNERETLQGLLARIQEIAEYEKKRRGPEESAIKAEDTDRA